jgi:uncharacterized membrane protein YczE
MTAAPAPHRLRNAILWGGAVVAAAALAIAAATDGPAWWLIRTLGLTGYALLVAGVLLSYAAFRLPEAAPVALQAVLFAFLGGFVLSMAIRTLANIVGAIRGPGAAPPPRRS